ncbi:hypothetical protein LTR22_026251 [Elasticomyces elasticus]|nr:hypothetical protein LTR22_026251 [Elasticomyces elasticus]
MYLEKVHPCYGVVDYGMLHQSVSNAWERPGGSSAQDAVLCGVGALAYLFSGAKDVTVESSLVLLAKCLLDPSTADPPSRHSATAWVLRTAYLRLTARPEEAWLARCTTLHIIEACDVVKDAGCSEPFSPTRYPGSANIGKRIFGVAQHLNMWMSYDVGRSRVKLPDAGHVSYLTQPNDYTIELLELLPYSQDLDPANEVGEQGLTRALQQILGRTHSQPSSVLAQCNLMLYIYRTLHVSNAPIPEDLLKSVIALTGRSIEAARSSMAAGLPWYHVAKIPFQAVRTLLAIDTMVSFALLSDATACLVAVNDTYQTGASWEAVTAAYALVQLHRKRREAKV